MDRMNSTRCAKCVVERSEHHREDVTERALEPTDDIGARARMVIDRERNLWMCELE